MNCKAILILSSTLSLAIGCGGGSSSDAGSPAPTPAPVVLAGSTWTGTYSNSGGSTTSPYRMTFFADGKSRVSSDGSLTSRGDGTWTLTSPTAIGTYTYRNGGSTFSTLGTVSGTTMTGTWGSGTATSGSGTFTLTQESGPALGVWTGKYGVGTDAATYNYRFILYANGTMDSDIDGTNPFDSHGAGTWTLTGTTLKGTYTYAAPSSGTYSFSCTLAGNSLTAGTWGSGASATGGGTFTMTR